jgi:hypothetical protein
MYPPIFAHVIFPDNDGECTAQLIYAFSIKNVLYGLH